MSAAPVKIAAAAPVAKKKSGGGLRKFALIVVIIAAITLIGPSVAVVIGYLAYPLIIPAVIVGAWIYFDSKRAKRK